jgi:hypothetical protein
MTDIVAQVLARVHHWQDDRGQAYCLQIELGNDHAITLTVSEKERPSVDVWHGQGEHSFVRTDIDPGETLESFREFVAEAFEPPAEQGTKGLPTGSRR